MNYGIMILSKQQKDKLMNTRKSKKYLMTVDYACAGDIFELEKIRKAISIVNKGNGRKFYVKLAGRGPRTAKAIFDDRSRRAYDSYLPLRHANTADVYIYER
jgi:hypothetical protein